MCSVIRCNQCQTTVDTDLVEHFRGTCEVCGEECCLYYKVCEKCTDKLTNKK